MSKLGGVDHRVIGVVFGITVLGGLIPFGAPRLGVRASKLGSLAVNLGFFANVTHAPALVGLANGAFQRAVGQSVEVVPRQMGAGPQAMEALVAGDLDVVYVGPSPAINTYIRTHGRGLRIISGVCQGGASLVAAPGTGIRRLSDLAGKRVAVPQLGNTQDISLRHFIKTQGLAPKDDGGDVEIIPVQNSDTLMLFKRRSLDAAWVPEPWATRLVEECGATRVLDERSLWPNGEFATTVLVARTAFADAHPDIVTALVKANADNISWILQNPNEAHRLVNQALANLRGRPGQKAVPDVVWTYLTFSTGLNLDQIESSERFARECGFLKSAPQNLAAIYDPRFLAREGTRTAE